MSGSFFQTSNMAPDKFPFFKAAYQLVAVVAASDADDILAKMKQSPYAAEAVIIGEVTAEHKGKVVMKTALGASRIVDMLSGELLPRIC